jgi:fatty acyl-CoA reductase
LLRVTLINKQIQIFCGRLIGNFPNVYAYTKALGENILEDLAQCEGRLPLVIVRPSIVIAAIREPIPGWVDDFNGHSGKLTIV